MTWASLEAIGAIVAAVAAKSAEISRAWANACRKHTMHSAIKH